MSKSSPAVESVGLPTTADFLFSDYDVFLSPLSDFQKAMEDAGLQQDAVYLDRGEQFDFRVLIAGRGDEPKTN